MGFAALAGAAIIVFVPLLLYLPIGSADPDKKKSAAHFLRFILALAITSNALGDLGLYQLYRVGFEFDKLVHLSTSLASTFILPIILNKRFSMRMPYAIAISFATLLILGVGWEVFERLADFSWETHISGVYGLDINNDTKFDLVFDAIGSVSGAIASIARLSIKRNRETNLAKVQIVS